MERFDFAVIGAGIAGASFAARMAPHARVLLLEQEPQPGYHATGRSAALYSALYGNAAITALTRASRPFFDAPPPSFADHPLLTPRGVLYCGGEADQAAVDDIAASPLATPLDTAAALARVPVLKPSAARWVAFEASACDIDVNALHQGFLRMARSAGAVLATDAAVTALEFAGCWRISTAAGPYEAEVLVNAAGAWADQIASLAGAAPLGLTPLRRTALLLETPGAGNSAHWPAVIGADESFYFKPDAGLLLASPADETPTAPGDAQPEEMDIAICVDRVEAATTLSIRRVVRAWAGLRTFAPDRSPVVGYDARMNNFFWLAGQGGYGVQTAPALSELAAALALGHPVPASLADQGLLAARLSPARLSPALRAVA
jgi:D-arginine dehydrogenase